jgi:hypothetical protein
MALLAVSIARLIRPFRLQHPSHGGFHSGARVAASCCLCISAHTNWDEPIMSMSTNGVYAWLAETLLIGAGWRLSHSIVVRMVLGCPRGPH